MKIGSNSNLSNQMKQTSNKIQNLFAQLSSGKRVNSGQDDPATLALINSLDSATRGLQTANRGISYTQGALQTAGGALSQTTEQLQSMRELAVQAANGTLSDTDRASLQEQFDQGLQNLDYISKNTKFGESSLLDGNFSQTVQTGSNSTDTASVSVGSVSSSALGLSSSGVSTQSAAQDALEAIDAAMAEVNQQQANVGAQQNALEFSSEANAVAAENMAAARSQAGDTDYASALSDLAANEVKQKAQIFAAQAKQDAQKSYMKKLLGG